MGLGAAVRRRLGKYEAPASDLYRSLFIDVDALAEVARSLAPEARRIAEIGCGDGSVAEALLAVLPQASYVGVDVAPEPGRLFRGDRGRARFDSKLSSDLLAETGPGGFDLVVVVDVVHHVADADRAGLLRDAADLVGPGGLLLVKEWERGAGLGHLLAYTSDRYVSGDATVRFMDGAEIRGLIETAAPDFTYVVQTRIPPRRNNLLIALRKPSRVD